MTRLFRTTLAVAAFAAVSVAQASPVDTGTYTLGTELASPDSFGASLTTAAAGSELLSFQVAGFASLDGAGGNSDVFHLGVNGAEVYAGTFNMGGGGNNTVLLNTNGATTLTTTYGATDDAHNSTQVTWAGGVTDISLPINLLAGLNTLTFWYTGAAQGLGDEGWAVNSVTSTSVTAPVPEPQTYALMLAGLGVVGFMMRRRGSRRA